MEIMLILAAKALALGLAVWVFRYGVPRWRRLAMTNTWLKSALIVVGLSSASNPAQTAEKDGHVLVEELDKVGYFALSDINVEKLREDLISQGWGYAHDENRMTFSDAEDLSEGGFSELVGNLNPIFERLGIGNIKAEQGYDKGSEYWASIGDKKAYLYRSSDLDRADQPGWLWGVSSARAFGLINDELAARGSEYKLFAMSGGEEMSAIVLKPNEADIIARYSEPRERPYILTEDYSSFGMPK